MKTIKVKTTVNAPLESVWNCWTQPEHITNWNFAADDWHCPAALNNFKAGGKFSWRMEAKDGSMTFDYAGHYDKIEEYKSIEKHLNDGRKVWIHFEENAGITTITEEFEPENVNEAELQRQGWQMILDNFGKYAEGL